MSLRKLLSWTRKAPVVMLGLIALLGCSFSGYHGFRLARHMSSQADEQSSAELQSEDVEGSVNAASVFKSVRMEEFARLLNQHPLKLPVPVSHSEQNVTSQPLVRENVSNKSNPNLQVRKSLIEQNGLGVEVIEGGLKGGFHEEPGFVQWRDIEILMGSFNVSRKQAPPLAASHPELLAIGSTRVDIFNLTTREVSLGPELPILMHHPAAAISPEGVIHVLGSNDWVDVDHPNNDAYHFTWDVSGGVGGGEAWVEREKYLGSAGGFACAFVESLMYCCGGGRRLQEPTGKVMRVYDPATDTWTDAAPLPEAADHISLLVHEGELWAVGGASTLPAAGENTKYDYDHFRHSLTQVAVYNPGANQWSVKQSLPTARAGPVASIIQRPGKRPSMLVGGGEQYLSSSGLALASLSEYDFEEDVWFCFVDPLPLPVFGAATAVFQDQWYIMAGGESYQLSATDRVMVVDITKLPIPEPCSVSEGLQRKEWWLSAGASWEEKFPYRRAFLGKRKT